jgi:hypothetical protein
VNEQLVGSLAIQRSDLFRLPAILQRYCRRHATTGFYSIRRTRRKKSQSGAWVPFGPQADLQLLRGGLRRS